MLQGFDNIWEVNKAHHRELLDVAKTQRLLAQSRLTKVPGNRRLFVAIGDVLINFGVHLKARYEPAVH